MARLLVLALTEGLGLVFMANLQQSAVCDGPFQLLGCAGQQVGSKALKEMPGFKNTVHATKYATG
jgi:hypothetical protein